MVYCSNDVLNVRIVEIYAPTISDNKVYISTDNGYVRMLDYRIYIIKVYQMIGSKQKILLLSLHIISTQNQCHQSSMMVYVRWVIDDISPKEYSYRDVM